MAHYAFIDSDNKVVEVIVGKEENELLDGLTPEEWYGNFRGLTCLRTSYNGRIRYNFAGVGYSYDEIRDAFIPPRCHEEAVLDENICVWTCTNGDHDVRIS